MSLLVWNWHGRGNEGHHGKRRWTWRDLSITFFSFTDNGPQQIAMRVVAMARMLLKVGKSVLNVGGKCSCQLDNKKVTSTPPYCNIRNDLGAGQNTCLARGGHCGRMNGLAIDTRRSSFS